LKGNSLRGGYWLWSQSTLIAAFASRRRSDRVGLSAAASFSAWNIYQTGCTAPPLMADAPHAKHDVRPASGTHHHHHPHPPPRIPMARRIARQKATGATARRNALSRPTHLISPSSNNIPPPALPLQRPHPRQFRHLAARIRPVARPPLFTDMSPGLFRLSRHRASFTISKSGGSSVSWALRLFSLSYFHDCNVTCDVTPCTLHLSTSTH